MVAEMILGQLLTLGPGSLDQFPLTKDVFAVLDKEFAQVNEQSNKQLNTLMRTHQSLLPNPQALAVKQCRISRLPDVRRQRYRCSS